MTNNNIDKRLLFNIGQRKSIYDVL